MLTATPKISRADMIRCVLCADAPCNAACKELYPAGFLRSIWFCNEQTATQGLPEKNPCIACAAPCEQKCVRPLEVPIRDLMNRLYYQVKLECETPIPENEDRLKCDLCGIPLENPFLLSSSVVASTYDMCARAFEAGWAGICFKTISTLDIHEVSPRFSALTGNDGSIIGSEIYPGTLHRLRTMHDLMRGRRTPGDPAERREKADPRWKEVRGLSPLCAGVSGEGDFLRQKALHEEALTLTTVSDIMYVDKREFYRQHEHDRRR